MPQAVWAGLSFAACLGFAAAAQADGYTVPAEEPVAAEGLCFDKGLNEVAPCEEPPFVGPWTGFYAGVHGGYAWSNWDGEIERQRRPTRTLTQIINAVPDRGGIDFDDLDASGFVIGGQIGYNHQLPNNLVLGVEGDFSYAVGLDESIEAGGRRRGVDVETSIDWLASLRLRAGYAIGDVMPFVTGGVGFAHYEVDGEINRRGRRRDRDHSISDVAVGPVVGGGLEYMISPNMLIRGEGLYYIFNENVDLDGDRRRRRGVSTDLELESVLVGRVALSIKF